jgi:membrane protein
MPDCRVLWGEAFSGGTVAAAVWEAGSYLFVALLPYFDYEGVYGRTGAIIALLVWVYTSTLIMLFGANFSTHLHRQKAGTNVDGPSGESEAAGVSSRVRSFPNR